ncbi:uncharacterized protein LOC136067423 [Quercus suber]|uniref:uncharacterized protein LOC136067423 n=1 Tax=Quercus suber TaxID=58331 RepID=UPI0032DFAB5F
MGYGMKTCCWPEKRSLKREKDRKTYGRIEGGRWLGLENNKSTVKDEGVLPFPGKLKGDPNKRFRDKYCRFHRDHGHDTTNYYNLKQQIEALIRQGKLQGLVSKERTGSPQEQGGPKRPANSFIPKMAQIDNPIIEFSEEDARHLCHQHDDALVVNIRVGDYNTHRVLVDNGSSADILYYPAFQQMRIDRERLVLTNTPHVGFKGTRLFPFGAVTLSVTVGDYPQQITKDVTFLVVNYSSVYNAIIGRTTPNSWKVVTLTYHLMNKFPTDYGVGELRGEQLAACECYIAMLEMDDHLQAINREEH